MSSTKINIVRKRAKNWFCVFRKNASLALLLAYLRATRRSYPRKHANRNYHRATVKRRGAPGLDDAGRMVSSA